MNVFENLRSKVLNLFDNKGWIKWVHEGTILAYTQKERIANIEYSNLSNHCALCLNLNGCCFPKNNMPRYPLHFKCHCKLEPVTKIYFNAECPIEKFTNYIFDPIKNGGKKDLFESWGYGKMDSQWLQEEFCRQAQEKYANGDFTLDRLDKYGQRINIEITLPRKDGKGEVTFMSGWMVYPNGKIQLATPYGDD